jgi:hypothetical protein
MLSVLLPIAPAKTVLGVSPHQCCTLIRGSPREQSGTLARRTCFSEILSTRPLSAVLYPRGRAFFVCGSLRKPDANRRLDTRESINFFRP